ncbi:MAG TPA: DUF3300 domain-containing protein, partial [Candidatus Sulfotelmatobacter sp.]|nr:DUF3300 domain-containing protein [Candidatus Sulfotelmatobacter sp.]
MDKNSCFGVGSKITREIIALFCAALLVPGESLLMARQDQSESQTEKKSEPAEKVAKLPADQLDSLVAPIALYPDPLLAQTLAASTYPLEVMQLQ